MWRFVHLTDMHLGSSVDGEWNNRFVCTMMPEVVSCLRRDLAKLNPDFLLVTGDIVSHQSRDATYASRDLLDSLGIPYYPTGGNHDFLSEAARARFVEAFGAHLPEGDTVYSFVHKDLRFCILDPWWKWSDGTLCASSEQSVAEKIDTTLDGARWALPPHQFAWLENELDEHDEPTIIAMHYPAIPIPKRMHRPGMKDAGCLDNGDLLIELLVRYPQVKAIFSGHVHMNFIEPSEGLVHIVTSSLPEYPTEYRDVRVFPDRLEISTLGLSDESFAARSLIPGHEWIAGETPDRESIVRLR